MKSEHEFGTLQARDGLDLFWSRDVPANAKAAVVIVHGLAEHSGRYDYVTEKLNLAGFTVYRFDNRGHGKSGGDRAWLEDFQEYIDDAATVVEKAHQDNPAIPVFMLGHSMGGFIATGFAIKYPGMVKGHVFSGAAVGPLPAFDFLKDMDYRPQGRDTVPNGLGHLVSRNIEIVKDYANDPDVLKHISLQLAGTVWKDGVAWIAANAGAIHAPSLVLHGGDDQIVPPDASRWLFEHISSKDKQLKIYPGLYHEILNEPEKDAVLADIATWMNERV